MERTWRPTAGGVLSIISGVFGVIVGAVIAFWSGILSSLGGDLGSWFGGLGGLGGLGGFGLGPGISDIAGIISAAALVIGIVLIVFGVIAIVGGVHSIKRQRWGLALAGAILALPFLPFMGILGLLAVIFISLGKREFF